MKSIRLALKIKQKDVREAVGMNTGNFSSWENGKYNAKPEIVEKVRRYLIKKAFDAINEKRLEINEIETIIKKLER